MTIILIVVVIHFLKAPFKPLKHQIKSLINKIEESKNKRYAINKQHSNLKHQQNIPKNHQIQNVQYLGKQL